jgi:uncharacterized protein (TIGR02996 family)
VSVARPTYSTLFPAILDEPDVDAHRLVYADWLEEHGQAKRAEFIRVQVELATMAGDDPRRFDLTKREAELLERNRTTWAADLPKWVQPRESHGVTYRRGFVDEVRCTTINLVIGLGGLLRRTPLQAALLHRMRPGNLDRLAALPGLARLTGLDLLSPIPEELERLAASPHLTGLRRLGMYWCPVPLRNQLRVLRAPAFARLTELSLAWSESHRDDLADLVAHPVFPGLTSLHFFLPRGNLEDIRSVAESPRAARLTSLEFGVSFSNGAGAGILPILAASPHLRNLTFLKLDCGYLPEADVEALAASPHLVNLTDLSLGWAALTPRGWEALLRSPTLTRLTRLHVHGWDYKVPQQHGLVPLKTSGGILWVWVQR